MTLTQMELHESDRIAVVTLNYAAKRNALSRAMLNELQDRLSHIADLQTINVVIIRAEGPAFSAGHDLKEILGGDMASVRTLFQTCAEVMDTIRHLPQIVMAEVSGIATAAGCQLVAASDLAIAADTARFATPGVKIGYFCASPSVQVARNVPLKKAAEMLFTGDFISAPEALQYGLVNRLSSEGDLRQEAWQFAQTIAQWSLPVLSSGKEFLYQQVEMSAGGAAHYAIEYMARQSSTADAVEGMTAFFEKRTANWSDRLPVTK